MDGTTYSQTPALNEVINSSYNGLNQIVAFGSAAVSHDARGNLTGTSGGESFTYDALNRLTGTSSSTASTTLGYDPLGRLHSYGKQRPY